MFSIHDSENVEEADDKIRKAMTLIFNYGGIDDDHHKMWVLDQVAQALLGDQYDSWVDYYEGDPEDEENHYSWDQGIAP